MTAAFSTAAHPMRWRPTKRCGGFTSARRSVSTEKRKVTYYGIKSRESEETTNGARSEAQSGTLAAAGAQAAPDVDTRARRPAEPGSRRKPHARRGPDGGPAAD